MKFCLIDSDNRVILAKRSFEAYGEEHRMKKLNVFIWLSGRKTVSGRLSLDSNEMFQKIKKPHRKPGCLDCNNGNFCSDCVILHKLKCFNCEVERACKLCLDPLSQKKT